MTWLTRRSNIFMYHRVAVEANDPFSLCVSPKHFAEQLEALIARADVVTIDELDQTGKRPRVALTLDDGYVDNLELALPVIERLGVPITIFIISGMIGSAEGFWWDRLADVLYGQNDIDTTLELPSGPFHVRLTGAGAARRALDEVHVRLMPLSVDWINQAVDALSSEFRVEHTLNRGARPLTRKELLQLAANPLVTIGAHTTHHGLLIAQSAEAQFETIATSKVELEAMLAREVRHFAYPFGANDRHSVGAVRRAGLATACTTKSGYVTPWSNPLSLPRRKVYDWDAWRFGRHLSAWGIA